MKPAPRCKCCGHPQGLVRFCRQCGKTISPGHKYRRVKGGLVHRCCAWPDSYLGPAGYRQAHGDRMFRHMAPVLFKGLHIPALKAKEANEKGLTRRKARR